MNDSNMGSLLNLKQHLHRDVLPLIWRYLSRFDIACCFAAHGCKIQDAYRVQEDAAKRGYTARVLFFPMPVVWCDTESIVNSAISFDHAETLKAMLRHGYYLPSNAGLESIRHDSVSAFAFLMSVEETPHPRRVEHLACVSGSVRILAYLESLNLLQLDGLFWLAVQYEHRKVISFVAERTTDRQFDRSGVYKLDLMMWMIENKIIDY